MQESPRIEYTGDRAQGHLARRTRDPRWQGEQDALAALVEKLPPGTVLLDMPVGTGRFLPEYAQRNLQVLGVDISWDMLQQGKPFKGTNTVLCLGDARQLPLRDHSIDCTVCFRLIKPS